MYQWCAGYCSGLLAEHLADRPCYLQEREGQITSVPGTVGKMGPYDIQNRHAGFSTPARCSDGSSRALACNEDGVAVLYKQC